MGLSTHVLDTMHGCPAAGMEVKLYATDGEQATLLKSLTLNHDGRTDAPLFDNHSLKTGTYRLSFNVAGYFKAKGVQLPEPNFLSIVHLDFGVAMQTSTTTCRCWSAPGATLPTAAPESPCNRKKEQLALVTAWFYGVFYLKPKQIKRKLLSYLYL